MGSKTLIISVALALAAALGLGCGATWSTSGAVVYDEPPPPRYAAVIETRPNSVWTEGHWEWNGAQWVWMDGYWQNERAGYVWVQPTWVHRGSGWVYSQGTWTPRAQVRARGYYYEPRGGYYDRGYYRGRGGVEVRQAPTRGRVRVR